MSTDIEIVTINSYRWIHGWWLCIFLLLYFFIFPYTIISDIFMLLYRYITIYNNQNAYLPALLCN